VPVKVLISQSKDGELIARTLQFFGIHTIRGSSTRGGARALVQMIRVIRKGGIVAISPDGPRGPAEEIQQGILHVGQKTGCPIIPLAYDAKRKKIFNSWDRFYLPYPFNTVSIGYGEPLYLNKEESFQESGERLKQAMVKVARQCEEALSPDIS